MEATKVRLMTTLKCPRSCDGCCNTGRVFDQHRRIDSLDEVIPYGQVMITGGEPLLYPDRTLEIAKQIKRQRRNVTLYLYSSFFKIKDIRIWEELLSILDGFQYTLHYECSDQDVDDLRSLSILLSERGLLCGSYRLAIDARLYDKYDFSNIDFAPWSVVRKLVWMKDCPLPEGEELLYFPDSEEI